MNLFRLEVKKNFTRGEEFANSLAHGVGLIFGIVAWVILLRKGMERKDSLYLISVSIYSLSMITLFFNSMIYHGLKQNKRKDAFEKLDHASVYFLIAGTYTPFCLIAIGGTEGIFLCIFQWTLALAGVVLKFMWIDKFVKLHVVNYLVMGWLLVFVWEPMMNRLSSDAFVILFLGGISYSIGVLFYVFHWFKFHHLVWHLFVLFASVCMFLVVYAL